MAVIVNVSTDQKIILLTEHVIGRQNDNAHTHLAEANVSRVHALIVWNGLQWQIKDSSTNGTYINGRLLKKGQCAVLQKGDKLQFGSINNAVWLLKSSDAPVNRLVPQSAGLADIELNGLVGLPSDEEPTVQVFESADGEWLCETDGQSSVLRSGDLVGVDGNYWRFVDARPSAETQEMKDPSPPLTCDIQAVFTVSKDEEHVSLDLTVNGEHFSLGERSHHYLLLILARHRLNDAALPDSEQGWVYSEELSRQLRLSEAHINIQIYRIRKQLGATLPQALSASPLLERRPGQLRFGYKNIQILGGHFAERHAL
ncbi:FHA domain-containing protein [Marinagarivorans cellulosilyticus]|uniref:FHA domain-containing protein n=1 Tax=Marinagarivorans cellulosilyticus TaxID=2721545 RepID=A0AAN1WFJ0_9GAMM|nr:FHA domain-containing protein [Marinagarivorans cellulosilyticus]BCD96656.1 hypothetical protein MARGE09_P0856 [Marinagarivorans cellulosilyticus]